MTASASRERRSMVDNLTRERLNDIARLLAEWAASEYRHPTPQGRMSVGERHILEDAVVACGMALSYLDQQEPDIVLDIPAFLRKNKD